MNDDIYNKYASENGEIIYQGKCYALMANAEPTNREFAGGWQPYLKDGDEYISEWSAPAIGEDGEEYVVVWQFDAVKGQEPEIDAWPWYKVYDVRAV